MKSRKFLIGLGFLAPFALGGCELLEEVLKHGGDGTPGNPGQPPRPCTLIGCSDQLNVTIRPAEGVFPSGAHEVVIEADGSPPRTCTFQFPISSVPGAPEIGMCSGGVFLTVAPVQTCTTMTDGNTASQTCQPVPGKFEERLHIPGTSPRVRVTQRTAGATYLDREIAATYKDVFPNGVACGAVCKQANVEWDF